MLTKMDFNNIMNYHDIRANEFVLNIDEKFIESDFFTKHLTSNTDVITDLVSPHLVKKLIDSSSKYIIKIRKNYPFHESLIEDCVSLSRTYFYSYTPDLIAAKDCSVLLNRNADLPYFIKAFDGELVNSIGLNTKLFENDQVYCEGKNLFVIYRPNPKLQRELTIRIFRKRIKEQNSSNEIFSLSDRKLFFQGIKKIIRENEFTAKDLEMFTQTLLQIWPCGARGRLVSYINMKEKKDDVVGDLIPWNTFLSDGNIFSLSGKKMPVNENTDEIKKDGLRRFYSFKRSINVDSLVMEGIMFYRNHDTYLHSGWTEIVSVQDPNIVVRSDGKFRWLRFPHGGMECIERLSDGKNIAIGSGYIERELGSLIENKKIIFLGLGLGVLQRKVCRKSDITTIESNGAVLDIFTTLYPSQLAQMGVVSDDFFRYLSGSLEEWQTIVIDRYDPNLESFQIEKFKLLLDHLTFDGTIIANLQVAIEYLNERITALTTKLRFAHRVINLQSNQHIVLINKDNGVTI